MTRSASGLGDTWRIVLFVLLLVIQGVWNWYEYFAYNGRLSGATLIMTSLIVLIIGAIVFQKLMGAGGEVEESDPPVDAENSATAKAGILAIDLCVLAGATYLIWLDIAISGDGPGEREILWLPLLGLMILRKKLESGASLG